MHSAVHFESVMRECDLLPRAEISQVSGKPAINDSEWLRLHSLWC